jgi:hypothetical protein
MTDERASYKTEMESQNIDQATHSFYFQTLNSYFEVLNYFERKNLQVASDEYYERAKSEYKILCILRYTKIHHSLSLEFHFYFFFKKI